MPNFDFGTPVSAPSLAAYATFADLVERYDVDRIKRLATDDRTEISVADLANHPRITAVLKSAAGRVEVSLFSGARYSRDDLNNLTENSKAYLTDLVCELAMLLLIRARGKNPEEREIMERRCESSLKELSSGKDVFALAPQIDAGLMEHVPITSIDIVNRNLTSDTLRGHLFAN